MTVLHDDGSWTRLEIGPTDNASAARTPTQPLRPIPEAARASFAPYVERMPGLAPGENDLTRIRPGRPQAAGQVISLKGRIMDRTGRPLRNTLVEIWNANKWGRYTHVDDPAREPIDPYFRGTGRAITNDQGEYEFLTIRPASYLARPDINRWRPAHVHFSLRGGGTRMITQMYFKDDPHLAVDPCFFLLHDAQQRHIGVEGAAEHPQADFGVRWDIVVGGRNATMFE